MGQNPDGAKGSTGFEIDQRRSLRRRMLKSAQIAFNEGASAIDCTIGDLSETGARLALTSVVGVPEFFSLVVQDQQARQCKIVWRKATQIGVAFL